MKEFEEWLENADADLIVAKHKFNERKLYHILCFHAQQAVEKSLKALLLYYGDTPPYTHNISVLLIRLGTFITVPSYINKTAYLSDYVAMRYPGEHEEITETEYVEAVQSADRVVTWAIDIIKNRPIIY
jgi:HEPN domain-containing protein